MEKNSDDFNINLNNFFLFSTIICLIATQQLIDIKELDFADSKMDLFSFIHILSYDFKILLNEI